MDLTRQDSSIATEDEDKKKKAAKSELNRVIRSLVHIDAKYDNRSRLRKLLRCGCDVDSRDSLGRTPLMLAIRRKSKAISKILLEAGADMFLEDDNNRSVLLKLFCRQDRLSPSFSRLFLRELQKRCYNSKEMAQVMAEAGCLNLHMAAFSKNYKIIRYYLQWGCPINREASITKMTALHVAVMLEDVKTVRVLLNNGIDMHALDKDGLNCLSYIYRHNEKHTVEKVALLRAFLHLGVSPTLCTSDGSFQIEPTLLKGDVEAIQVVLNSGIDFTVTDSKKRTLLHYLAQNTNPHIIKELELHKDKFKINEKDESGSSALYNAVEFSNVEMVKFLLEEGADADCSKDSRKFTPILYACTNPKLSVEKQNNQCIELLLQHYANICLVANKETTTILDVVPKFKNLHRKKLLVAHFALLEEMCEPSDNIFVMKIKSNNKLNKYFEGCRRIIKRKIANSVSVFDLLMADSVKMSKYINNRKLVLQLLRISYKQRPKLLFPYYWNTIVRFFLKGMEYATLKNKTALIISKIFKNRVLKTDLIVDKTIEYLDKQDLRQLYQLHTLMK